MSGTYDTQRENIHIHLTDVNKNSREREFDNENTQNDYVEKYIISLNDTLQTKQKEDMLTINTLEQKIEEMEEEVDSLEKKNSYLKSLLKNFHEMNKMSKELSKNNILIRENIEVSVTFFKYRATKHLRYLETLLIIFLGIFYEFYPVNYTFNVFIMLIIIVSFQESTLMNLIIPTLPGKENRNKELTTEIEKINKSQDYIHEFIDNI
jgi:hypothetical protein